MPTSASARSEPPLEAKGALLRTTDLPPLTRQQKGTGLFLLAASLSFVLSVSLWFAGSREEGVFVGLWVPSIFAAGAFWTAAVRPAR